VLDWAGKSDFAQGVLPAFAREASKAAAPKPKGEGGPLHRELRLGKPSVFCTALKV
jgi:hypothetical protein